MITRIESLARAALPWAAALLVAAHVGLVLRHFPPASLRSENPLCSQDLNLRFPACFEGSELHAAGGGLWGYSPYYMAGYPFGAWDSFGKRGDEFAPRLFPGRPANQAFYGYLVLATLLPPLLIGLAALVLGLGRRAALVCLCLAVVVFQLDNVTSYFWTFGNIAFPLGNGLGVLYAALLVRSLERRSFVTAAIAGLVLGLVGWVHQIVIIPAAITSLTAVWVYRKGLWRERVILYPLCTAAIALALIAPWLAVLWRFSPDRVPQVTSALQSGWKYCVLDVLSDRSYTHHFDRRAMLHVILVLFALGALRARAAERRLLPFVGGAVAAFVFTYSFEYVRALKETEPYRFILSFTMLALIPATLGLQELRRLFLEAGNAGRAVVAVLGVVLAPSLTGYLIDLAGREPAHGLDRDQWAVVQWLKSNGSQEGRVLCYEEEIGDVLPAVTRQQVVGGGISRRALLRHKFSWHEARRFFDSAPESFPVRELDEYLTRYNVAYLVMPGRRFDAALRQVPGCSEAFSSGSRVVYRLDAARLSYVAGAEGREQPRVTARTNHIRIEQPPTGRFVLKYHYLDSLKAADGVTLRPVTVGSDPVPFLEVENPSPRSVLEIVNE